MIAVTMTQEPGDVVADNDDDSDGNDDNEDNDSRKLKKSPVLGIISELRGLYLPKIHTSTHMKRTNTPSDNNMYESV